MKRELMIQNVPATRWRTDWQREASSRSWVTRIKAVPSPAPGSASGRRRRRPFRGRGCRWARRPARRLAGDEGAGDGHALALAAELGPAGAALLRQPARASIQHGFGAAPVTDWRRMRSGMATLSSAENSGSGWWNW